MKLRSFRFPFLVTTFLLSAAQAQMGLEGFQSGRYEVRKPSSSALRVPASDAAPSVTKVKRKIANSPKEQNFEQAETSEKSKTSVEVNEVAQLDSIPAKEPGIRDQFLSLFSEGADEITNFYKTKAHPDDIRQNKVELDFNPVLTYVDSQSSYSPRSYFSIFQGMDLGARVWFTPLIGVSGHMTFSLAGDMREAQGADSTQTYFENMDLAFRLRNFFDADLLAKSIEFSLHYIEQKVQPSVDSSTRVRFKTQALGLGLSARVPSSKEYAWTFGGVFYPRMQHTESGSASGYGSGSPEESVGMTLQWGGEWKFSRYSQILWGLESQLQKNVFSGSAAADPNSGLTPNNISVQQALHVFSLGYRWGH